MGQSRVARVIYMAEDRTGAATVGAARNLRRFGTEAGATTRLLNDFGSKGSRALNSVGRFFTRQIAGLVRSFFYGMRLGAVAAGAAVADFAFVSIRAFADFDKKLRETTSLIAGGNIAGYRSKGFGFAKSVRLAKDDAQQAYAQYSKAVLAMAPGLRKTPQDLIGGLYEITSAGITKPTKALSLLKVGAMGASVGNATTQEATRTLIQVMNALKIGGSAGHASKKQMMATMDKLFQAVNLGVGIEFGPLSRIIGQSVGQVGVAMGNRKDALDQMLGSIVVGSQHGLSYGQLGTGFANALQKLFKPSKSAEKFAASMGVGNLLGSEALSKYGFDNKNGVLWRLVDALKAHGVTQAKLGSALSKIFPDVRGIRLVSVLAQHQADTVASVGSIHGSFGATPAGFAEQGKSFGAKLETFKSMFEVAKIQFGHGLMPLVGKAMQTITNFISSFNGGTAGAAKLADFTVFENQRYQSYRDRHPRANFAQFDQTFGPGLMQNFGNKLKGSQKQAFFAAEKWNNLGAGGQISKIMGGIAVGIKHWWEKPSTQQMIADGIHTLIQKAFDLAGKGISSWPSLYKFGLKMAGEIEKGAFQGFKNMGSSLLSAITGGGGKGANPFGGLGKLGIANSAIISAFLYSALGNRFKSRIGGGLARGGLIGSGMMMAGLPLPLSFAGGGVGAFTSRRPVPLRDSNTYGRIRRLRNRVGLSGGNFFRRTFGFEEKDPTGAQTARAGLQQIGYYGNAGARSFIGGGPGGFGGKPFQQVKMIADVVYLNAKSVVGGAGGGLGGKGAKVKSATTTAAEEVVLGEASMVNGVRYDKYGKRVPFQTRGYGGLLDDPNVGIFAASATPEEYLQKHPPIALPMRFQPFQNRAFGLGMDPAQYLGGPRDIGAIGIGGTGWPSFRSPVPLPFMGPFQNSGYGGLASRIGTTPPEAPNAPFQGRGYAPQGMFQRLPPAGEIAPTRPYPPFQMGYSTLASRLYPGVTPDEYGRMYPPGAPSNYDTSRYGRVPFQTPGYGGLLGSIYHPGITPEQFQQHFPPFVPPMSGAYGQQPFSMRAPFGPSSPLYPYLGPNASLYGTRVPPGLGRPYGQQTVGSGMYPPMFFRRPFQGRGYGLGISLEDQLATYPPGLPYQRPFQTPGYGGLISRTGMTPEEYAQAHPPKGPSIPSSATSLLTGKGTSAAAATEAAAIESKGGLTKLLGLGTTAASLLASAGSRSKSGIGGLLKSLSFLSKIGKLSRFARVGGVAGIAGAGISLITDPGHIGRAVASGVGFAAGVPLDPETGGFASIIGSIGASYAYDAMFGGKHGPSKHTQTAEEKIRTRVMANLVQSFARGKKYQGKNTNYAAKLLAGDAFLGQNIGGLPAQALAGPFSGVLLSKLLIEFSRLKYGKTLSAQKSALDKAKKFRDLMLTVAGKDVGSQSLILDLFNMYNSHMSQIMIEEVTQNIANGLGYGHKRRSGYGTGWKPTGASVIPDRGRGGRGKTTGAVDPMTGKPLTGRALQRWEAWMKRENPVDPPRPTLVGPPTRRNVRAFNKRLNAWIGEEAKLHPFVNQPNRRSIGSTVDKHHPPGPFGGTDMGTGYINAGKGAKGGGKVDTDLLKLILKHFDEYNGKLGKYSDNLQAAVKLASDTISRLGNHPDPGMRFGNNKSVQSIIDSNPGLIQVGVDATKGITDSAHSVSGTFSKTLNQDFNRNGKQVPIYFVAGMNQGIVQNKAIIQATAKNFVNGVVAATNAGVAAAVPSIGTGRGRSGRGSSGSSIPGGNGAGAPEDPSLGFRESGKTFALSAGKQISQSLMASMMDGPFGGALKALGWLNRQVGKPYKMGGGHPPSLSSKAYDCSGLASSAMLAAGLHTSGTTFSLVNQLSPDGNPYIQLGFNKSKDPTHMGISVLGRWFEARNSATPILGPDKARSTWPMIGNPPKFHRGGVYKGPVAGGEGFALLRDEEMVVAPDQRGGLRGQKRQKGGGITINIEQMVVRDDQDIQRIAKELNALLSQKMTNSAGHHG